MIDLLKGLFGPKNTQQINVGVNNGAVVQANNVVVRGNDDYELESLMHVNQQDVKLLNGFLKRELEKCENHIYNGNYEEILHITGYIFTYNPQNLQKELLDKLWFYQFCAAYINGDEHIWKASYENLEGDLKDEAMYLMNVTDLEFKISEAVLLQKLPVVQKIVIYLLYKKEQYQRVTDLFISCIDKMLHENDNKHDFCSGMCFLLGLCLYNCTDYKDSAIYLEKSYNYKNESKVKYYLLCANFLSLYTTKVRTLSVIEKMHDMYHVLDDMVMKDYSLVKDNLNHWMWLSIHYYLYIKPEEFDNFYEGLSSELKNSDWIKHFHALHQISAKRYNEAYEELCCIDDSDEVLYLRAYCLLFLKNFVGIIDLYESSDLDMNNRRLRALYYEALRIENKEKLEQLVRNDTDANLDIEAFIEIFGVISEDRVVFNSYVLPFLLKHVDEIKQCECFYTKSIYFYFLIKHGDDKNIIDLFESFKTAEIAYNQDFASLCYNALLANINLAGDTIITISTVFIDAGVMENEFRRLRHDAYYRNHNINKALNDINKVFDCEQDLESAEKALDCLLNIRNNNKRDYIKYISYLEETCDAGAYSVLAVVYGHLKEGLQCIDFAYKSIYLLNGTMTKAVADNYFRSFLGFTNHKARHDLKYIQDDTVVTFTSVVNESDIVKICFEKGSFYQNSNENNSFNMKHINEANPEYYNLLGKNLGDVVLFEDEKYKVTSVLDKYVYMVRFMFELHDKEPDKYGNFIKTIKIDSTEDIIDKLIESMPDKDQSNDILSKYHCEDESFPKLGLPIDYISYYDYDKYIRVIVYLLFTKNEALYAGNCDCREKYSKYVISLSTLVTLAVFDCLDIVDGFKDNVFVPNTLLRFINERRRDAHAENRGGYLYKSTEGKLVLENNDEIARIWDSIYETCYRLKILIVDEKLRSDLKLWNQLSADDLMNSFGVASVQLDCFALAKQEKAVVICEDMFLRQVGAILGVISININYLLTHNPNYIKFKVLLEKIAMSNYIILNEGLVAYGVCNNIISVDSLLNGERKRKFYVPYLIDILKKLDIMANSESRDEKYE